MGGFVGGFKAFHFRIIDNSTQYCTVQNICFESWLVTCAFAGSFQIACACMCLHVCLYNGKTESCDAVSTSHLLTPYRPSRCSLCISWAKKNIFGWFPKNNNNERMSTFDFTTCGQKPKQSTVTHFYIRHCTVMNEHRAICVSENSAASLPLVLFVINQPLVAFIPLLSTPVSVVVCPMSFSLLFVRVQIPTCSFGHHASLPAITLRLGFHTQPLHSLTSYGAVKLSSSLSTLKSPPSTSALFFDTFCPIQFLSTHQLDKSQLVSINITIIYTSCCLIPSQNRASFFL